MRGGNLVGRQCVRECRDRVLLDRERPPEPMLEQTRRRVLFLLDRDVRELPVCMQRQPVRPAMRRLRGGNLVEPGPLRVRGCRTRKLRDWRRREIRLRQQTVQRAVHERDRDVIRLPVRLRQRILGNHMRRVRGGQLLAGWIRLPGRRSRLLFDGNWSQDRVLEQTIERHIHRIRKYERGLRVVLCQRLHPDRPDLRRCSSDDHDR